MKSKKRRINLFVSVIIIIAFASIIGINYKSYSRIIRDDIKNISKLTATNIYADINNELLKPIFVSLTMANDSFVKSWLENEELEQEPKEHTEQLKEYLRGIKEKYNYNSVFLVSNKSKNYYHYEKVQKVVSRENKHDKWYYDFINGGKLYELDIDNDEAAQNILTVFVNCRIEDENGQIMGTTGVGLQMNEIQMLLKSFENDYDLEAFIIDENGLVQIHTNYEFIENYNIYDDKSINNFQHDIINNKTDFETFEFEKNGTEGYLITKYIEELGWYLVIKKDTSVLKDSFSKQLINNFLIVFIVIVIVVFLINTIIRNDRKQITKMATTDQKTQLPNRRCFDNLLSTMLNDKNDKNFNVILFDIDNFKKFNDVRGHIFGDTVIVRVGNYVKDFIGTNGSIARWGGDEFSGVIYGSEEEGRKIVSDIIKSINQDPEFKELKITISLGLTHVVEMDTVETVVSRADKGLYIAKSRGKNQWYIN